MCYSFSHIADYYEQMLTRNERGERTARQWRQLQDLYFEYREASKGRMEFAK